MAKKQQLGHKDIELRLKDFQIESIPADEVGYQLLYCFGKGEADIRRYKSGKGVLKTFDPGLLIKGLFCYRAADTTNLSTELENLKLDIQVVKAAPAIIAVSDGDTIIAFDTTEKETFERSLERLCYDYDFFYPLMGVRKIHPIDESPADRKAAEKLAKLHDELRAYNEFSTDANLHDLNIFIARLLFCYFAEDSGIFEKDLFTNAIRQYTREDGSDICEYLDEIFNIMDVRERTVVISTAISQFPYVNGGLFAKHIQIPRMGQRGRNIILECGSLDWQGINPDIFGSMIQAVVNPEERANQGMHYTSVPNILKVIKPLFLDDLRAEFEKIQSQADANKKMYDISGMNKSEYDKSCANLHNACKKLLVRISKMKFFDPACGSGNFLIITYKMLRMLEMDVLKLMRQLSADKTLTLINCSVVRLDQFYGIELLDFPHEVAMLSLWLAEHQMNNKFKEEFGLDTQALPLKSISQIVCGNACRIDWNTVCPHTPEEEVYIFGNPPYLGSKLQSSEQKEDISFVFKKLKNSKTLDYIAIWFYLAAKYVYGAKAKFAFVSTNSITQGEQVGVLWPEILALNEEIFFAYTSFKWSNNAKHNAGVTVVIIGVQSKQSGKKLLYNTDQTVFCDKINPYLYSGSEIIVKKENKAPLGLPKLCFGSMPYDNGNLLFTKEEYDSFCSLYPNDAHFIKRIYGSEEFINDIYRYCLWIDDFEVSRALDNPEILRRVEKTRQVRLNSKDESGRKLAEKPYQFREHPSLDREAIIIPRVSSESRQYIPMGFLYNGNVISDSAFAIYDAELWLFGILTSKIHMLWARTVGGKLKTDYRYSAGICYNTFPFPKLTEKKRQEISKAAEEVLVTRDGYPGKNLAELYDPKKMPQDLLDAHHRLDDVVESCYPGYPFASDEARLECLFKLYEKMTSK